MIKHESKIGKDSEEVKRWKKALFDAGSLSGWPLKDGNESELIQRIVMEISTRLNRAPLHVAKYPVGIDSQVVKLESMLNLQSDDDVLLIGLWGKGGIGKTALAKAVYNGIFNRFRYPCFLANIRETSKNCKDLVTLQENLLFEVLGLKERLVVSSVDRGINHIQERLRHKKVILILDDVDDLRQLNALAGECKWFGNGSRINITTRNKHMLTSHGIYLDHVYEVKELDGGAAHELLSKHAFRTHKKCEIMTDLVAGVLNHAKGLPLALEVLGSFLHGRREDEWESALDKVSMSPNKDINDVLKISYEGLETNEKEIFLYIACFFKGCEAKYIKNVLDSCDVKAVIGLQILIERSLISIESDKIQMHDLIQLMGMDIVNRESDDPRRRSRLWLCDDVAYVVSSDMGDCVVKAIVLEPPEPTEIFISPDAFIKMRRLRLLILRNVHSSFQCPIYLPNELKWFEWDGCSSSNPEFSSGQKKLMGLHMGNCSITAVPNQFKDFQFLKYINFSDCDLLVCTPDLSHTPNLEELNIRNCKNLVEAHESIVDHDNLRELTIEKCTKFERFPDIPHRLERMKNLRLGGTAIKELPASVENFVALKGVYMEKCKRLEHLPSSIYKLQNLENLQVSYCPNLIEFPKYEGSADPCMETGLSSLHWLDLTGCNLSEVDFLENLSCFPVLRELYLGENNITTLPTSIRARGSLSLLRVENCHQLQEFPELPPFLNHLYADNCELLQRNEDLTLIHHFLRRDLTDPVYSFGQRWSDCASLLPGGEMPQWILPNEERSVSFMASKDLYDKILGMVLCWVFGRDEQGTTKPYGISTHVNGEKRRDPSIWFSESLDLEHLGLGYYRPSKLRGAVDFGQIDGNYAEFGVTILGGNIRKWGSRIICKHLGDDLKVELRDNQLIDPALFYEVDYESTDSVATSSQMSEDSSSEADRQKKLQYREMTVGKHSQIISRRNHRFSSLEACEPGLRALLKEAIPRQTSDSTDSTFGITTAHLPSNAADLQRM